MTQLPTGWAWSSVGDLGEYMNGRGFKKSEWCDSGRPIIRIQNLTGSGTAFNYYNGPLEDRYVVPPGSLLVSWAATLGVYIWTGPEGALNQHIFKVESFIDPTFHRYVLQHALDRMRSSTHGSGMVHITRGKFDETPIPVPPLAEQERIVAAIEEAFSLLDAGEASLHATRTRLKRMRDSVLAAAVTGQLVPHDPTSTSVPSHRGELESRPLPTPSSELPAGWSWCELQALSHRQDYGISVKAHELPGDGDVPMLRMGNISGGLVDTTSLKYVNPDEHAFPERLLDDGDLLFNRTNSAELVGKSAVYRGVPAPATFASYLIRVRLRAGVIPSWCAFVINSRIGRRYIDSVAVQQVGQANVNGSKLKRFPIPVPPLAEQVRIVAEVERQFSFIEAAERAVDTALARSAGLRRSVLKAAFEGRLVPQDSSDEPASVLLERIVGEHATAPKAARRGRAKVEAL